jgi:predicted ATPase
LPCSSVSRAAPEPEPCSSSRRHSPSLLACPGARIYSFDQSPIAMVRYEHLEHVTVTRDFLNDPGRFTSR